jgi:pimeloyl-ACP methyl ester carboxylesterase
VEAVVPDSKEEGGAAAEAPNAIAAEVAAGGSAGAGAVIGARGERVEGADGVGLSVRVFEPQGGRDDRAPFVLLHGIASTSVAWEEAALLLADAGRTVYTVDFRGHGLSDRPEEGYDLETFASDLLGVLAQLKIHRPVLVGHSLGASVILQAIGTARPIASGIALIEGGLVDAQDQFATPEECLDRTALPPVAGMSALSLKTMLRQLNPDWSDIHLAAPLAALDVKPNGTVEWVLTPVRYVGLLGALWTARAADRWPSVRVPALVVVADTGDAAFTAAKRKAADAVKLAIPGVRVEWFTAPHDIHTEQPDVIARLLLEVFA